MAGQRDPCHADVGRRRACPAPTTTVEALRISPTDQMPVTRQFYGQIEAAQTVSLGFEQSGRLNVLTVDEVTASRRGMSSRNSTRAF
ncbi:MAG: hypothetical protein ABJX32_10620 [Tateyamaria sp.]|uniref:hypothetical protein n=1 Tax=Tateyamaria sp. TaxID=1929288 RepID=UPI00329DCE3B